MDGGPKKASAATTESSVKTLRWVRPSFTLESITKINKCFHEIAEYFWMNFSHTDFVPYGAQGCYSPQTLVYLSLTENLYELSPVDVLDCEYRLYKSRNLTSYILFLLSD